MFYPSELTSDGLKTMKHQNDLFKDWLAWSIKLSLYIWKLTTMCLTANCRTSQRLNDPSHKSWVCVEKLSGVIKTVHCSCMAGLWETCNHVAPLLFRVEAVVTCGLCGFMVEKYMLDCNELWHAEKTGKTKSLFAKYSVEFNDFAEPQHLQRRLFFRLLDTHLSHYCMWKDLLAY